MVRVRFNARELQYDLTGKLIQFVNVKVLRDGKITWDHLWVRDGKIIDGAAVFYDEKRKADIEVDCEGYILSPGFIDIQINGGFGVDFSTLPSTDIEYQRGVEKVSRGLLSHGVTSFAPTVITSPPEVYARVSSEVDSSLLIAHQCGRGYLTSIC
ncbi:phage tail component protein [Ancylostoma duodenale]|uniref:Phage tail component protein n=1 Tax=Ancylostoma duodenale TaxID=51022 RepID=A0A0C2DWP2_9BILA|nr:phage tail component protein [Ancylostoma duodenale]